jgi:hypothetical protein
MLCAHAIAIGHSGLRLRDVLIGEREISGNYVSKMQQESGCGIDLIDL